MLFLSMDLAVNCRILKKRQENKTVVLQPIFIMVVKLTIGQDEIEIMKLSVYAHTWTSRLHANISATCNILLILLMHMLQSVVCSYFLVRWFLIVCIALNTSIHFLACFLPSAKFSTLWWDLNLCMCGAFFISVHSLLYICLVGSCLYIFCLVSWRKQE